jgi:hypothetical protein
LEASRERALRRQQAEVRGAMAGGPPQPHTTLRDRSRRACLDETLVRPPVGRPAAQSPSKASDSVDGRSRRGDGIYAYRTSDGLRWRFVFRHSDGTLSSRRGFANRSEAMAARRRLLEEIRRGEVRISRESFETFWHRVLRDSGTAFHAVIGASVIRPPATRRASSTPPPAATTSCASPATSRTARCWPHSATCPRHREASRRRVGSPSPRSRGRSTCGRTTRLAHAPPPASTSRQPAEAKPLRGTNTRSLRSAA